jgi:hypothetical protein
VKRCKPAKTWTRTGHRNLIRHKSGRYYARAFAGGKEVWQSPKASHYSVARARLGEFLKDHRARASNSNGEVSAKMTFGEAAAIHLRNLDDNLRIKPSTRDYWLRRLLALIKLRVDDYDFRSWATRASKDCLQAGAVYEYARESRKLRALLVLMNPNRHREAWEIVRPGSINGRRPEPNEINTYPAEASWFPCSFERWPPGLCFSWSSLSRSARTDRR